MLVVAAEDLDAEDEKRPCKGRRANERPEEKEHLRDVHAGDVPEPDDRIRRKLEEDNKPGHEVDYRELERKVAVLVYRRRRQEKRKDKRHKHGAQEETPPRKVGGARYPAEIGRGVERRQLAVGGARRLKAVKHRKGERLEENARYERTEEDERHRPLRLLHRDGIEKFRPCLRLVRTEIPHRHEYKENEQQPANRRLGAENAERGNRHGRRRKRGRAQDADVEAERQQDEEDVESCRRDASRRNPHGIRADENEGGCERGNPRGESPSANVPRAASRRKLCHPHENAKSKVAAKRDNCLCKEDIQPKGHPIWQNGKSEMGEVYSYSREHRALWDQPRRNRHIVPGIWVDPVEGPYDHQNEGGDSHRRRQNLIDSEFRFRHLLYFLS